MRILPFLTFAGSWTLALVSAPSIWGLTLNDQAGATYDGEIEAVFEGNVNVVMADGSRVAVALASLTPDSQSAVVRWGKSNPDKVDVYAQVDENPKPVKTSTPQVTGDLRKVTGMVTVAIVLDEKGNIIHSAVHKSTDQRLEQPSLQALEFWRFEPAKKDGKPVKVRLTIPFRYSGS